MKYQNELQQNFELASQQKSVDNVESQTNNDQPPAHLQLSTNEQDELLDLIAVLDTRIGVLHVESEDRPSGDRYLSKGSKLPVIA